MIRDKITSLVTDQGEIVGVTERRPPGRSYGRLFHTTFTREQAALAVQISSAATLKVLMVLPNHLSYTQFRRLDQVKLADQVGIEQPSVSRAMKQLHDLGVVERRGKGPVVEWRLTTEFGWRGDVAGFHAFRKDNKPEPPLTDAADQEPQKIYYANSRAAVDLPPPTADVSSIRGEPSRAESSRQCEDPCT